MPPIPRKGRTATASTMIPIPPSHWLKPRQKRRPRGSEPGSEKIEAPVVVKPEIDSKKASSGEAMPASQNGSAPKTAALSQPTLTIR